MGPAEWIVENRQRTGEAVERRRGRARIRERAVADDAVMGIARAITAHFRAVAEELRCRPLTLADLRQMALKAGVPPAEVYGESGEADDGSA